jgi:hypothetical protein
MDPYPSPDPQHWQEGKNAQVMPLGRKILKRRREVREYNLQKGAGEYFSDQNTDPNDGQTR